MGDRGLPVVVALVVAIFGSLVVLLAFRGSPGVAVTAAGGGTFQHEDGPLLHVPPGVLRQDTRVVVKPADIGPGISWDTMAPRRSQPFDFEFVDDALLPDRLGEGEQLTIGLPVSAEVQDFDLVFVATFDEVAQEWMPVPFSRYDPALGLAVANVEHFSIYQVREFNLRAVEAEMGARFRQALEDGLAAEQDPVAPCARVAGFEAEVVAPGLVPPVAGCLDTNEGQLHLELRSMLSSALMFTPPDEVDVVEVSRGSIWEEAVKPLESVVAGAVLIPGRGFARLVVPVSAAFPVRFDTLLEPGPLLFAAMAHATGSLYRLEVLPSLVECVTEVWRGEVDSLGDGFVACMGLPVGALPPGVMKAMATGLDSAMSDGGRLGELLGSVTDGTGRSTVVIRRTDEPVSSALASAFDESFVYTSGGFRYRATIHFGAIRFPTEHSCEGAIASPGWTWLEIPYTVESLTTDRPAPPIPPLLVLVDRQELDDADAVARMFGAGAELLDPHAIRFGSEPASCDVMSGDYDPDARGIRPGGTMTGVFTERSSAVLSRGTIFEELDLDNYVVGVWEGRGALYDLEDLAGPWTLAGRLLRNQ